MSAKWILILGALVVSGCYEREGDVADLVFRGGVVWTGVTGADLAESLAVTDGRVTAVGSDAELDALVGPETEVVELEGRALVPGFIDAHTHFISGGFQLSSVDLRDAATPEEFARRIGDFAQGLPEGAWITGGDWDHEMWGGELPRSEWVDGLTPRNPVFVQRLDGHMALANTLALEAGGVTAATADPPGGTIVRDASGVPAGVLKDEAMGLVSRAIPPSSEAELDDALQAAAAHALSLGVTQVHDMGGWGGLEAYRRAHASGRLPLRVYAVVPMASWERMRDYVAENGKGDRRLWWGGLKAFVDGSLGSTTAWFYDPYDDEPGTSGLMTTDTTELRSWIVSADAEGLHVIVHAIGDRANDWLLDVYAQIEAEHGPRDRRFRIEHAQHLSPEAFARFASQGVIASMQPYHAADDGRWAERRIGAERIRTTYAFRSLLEHDATLAFGSDWTVAPLDPLLGVDAAVTRRTIDGANPDGWVPEERISLEQTLRAYTQGGARAGFMEDVVGELAPGKLADLVVLSSNIFEMSDEELVQARVDLTVVEGEIVYDAGGGAQ
jgi:predicted amidohydrolase YtcJ